MKKLFSSLVLSLLFTAIGLGQSANMKTVMTAYESFGKGDIPAIIAACAPDVVWSHAGNHDILPFAGAFVGQDGVGQFFQKVAAAGPITSFVPSDFQENGHNVWNKVALHGKSAVTGKEHDSVMTFVWTFDDMGRVVRWTAEGDTRAAEMAFSK